MSELKLTDEEMKTLELIRKNGFSIYENFDTNKRREFDIERFREEKQPVNFNTKENYRGQVFKIEFDDKDILIKYKSNLIFMRYDEFDDLILKIRQARKGTDFECKDNDKILESIATWMFSVTGMVLHDESVKILRGIIESGGTR